MVLVTKYRKPVLDGKVKDLVYTTIQDIFKEKGLVILEMNGDRDHVHILFEADPYTTPGELVNIIKTKTAGDLTNRIYAVKPHAVINIIYDFQVHCKGIFSQICAGKN